MIDCKRVSVGYTRYKVSNKVDWKSLKKKDGNKLGARKQRIEMDKLIELGLAEQVRIFGGNMVSGSHAGTFSTTLE